MTDELNKRDPVITGVSIVILGFYLGMVAWLLHAIKTTPEFWERTVFLLSGIEAIVFGASGFLFGREVNRARAVSAESRAVKSEAEAKKAAEEKAGAEKKGEALAAAIDAKAKSFSLRPLALGVANPPNDEERARSNELVELQELARRLFRREDGE